MIIIVEFVKIIISLDRSDIKTQMLKYALISSVMSKFQHPRGNLRSFFKNL